MGAEGTEHPQLSSEKQLVSVERGTESGTPADGSALAGLSVDPGLARLIVLWPQLPESTRKGIFALIEPAGKGGR